MSSDSDSTIFLTQSSYKERSPNKDTDEVLSDIVDMENEVKKPNFNIKSDLFSDISEEEMVQITQELEKAENQVESRFHTPLKECHLNGIIETEKCQNTENKTKWAVRIFETWRKERNQVSSVNKIDTDLLRMSSDELNLALSYFVAEVRNQAGSEYLPNTLYELVIAIQHYLRQNGRFINILDDTEFGKLRQILDARMKCLSRQGIGNQRRQAEIITTDQENELWLKNILGTNTPQKLLDTLIYVLGLNFALRAGKEHRNLRFGENQQITVRTDSSGKRFLEYQEDISKTNAGGLLHRKVTPKVTRAYQNEKQPERCPVRIYEKYVSLRPQNCKTDAFYLRPLKYISNTCWYCDIPIGVHTLQQTVGKLCKEAGFKGFYTNHSLRATAATRLYNAGLDEQLVSEKTGHRSLAVRSYKRTSDLQLENVSDVVQGNTCDSCVTVAKRQCLSPTQLQVHQTREITVSSDNVSFTLKF